VPEGQRKEVALKCAVDIIGGKVLGATMHFARIPERVQPGAEIAFNTFVMWMERTRADGVTVRYQTIVEILPYGGCVSWVVPENLTFDIPGLPTGAQVLGLPED
jgi:hypothetical protein